MAAGPDAQPEAALHVDIRRLRREGEAFVAPLTNGGKATLTLVPTLQERAQEIFTQYELPYAAAVMMSIPDGRILALAGHSELDAQMGPADLAMKAWAPAASVFKLISATAMVSRAGLTAKSEACYHGGYKGLYEEHIQDNPKLDTSCDSLAYAIGKSQNALIAKLTVKHLTPEALRATAMSFGFGHRIPFVADAEASAIDVPREGLEFARAAAGFYHSSLSPFHGALLAATLGNEGVMPRPLLIENAVDRKGKSLPVPGRRARRVVKAEVAKEVAEMMEVTTRIGTARTSFHDRRGRPFLPFKVAGKTGSLNYRGQLGDPPQPAAGVVDGYLQYVWFVGFAPLENPEVAFAVVLGNPAKWRIKAAYAAQRLLAAWHAEKQESLRLAREQQERAKAQAEPAAEAGRSTDEKAELVAADAANTKADDSKPASRKTRAD